MVAYDYPILGLFWTMLLVFLWIAWIIVLFRVLIDIFRSHDMGGWGKALWTIFVIVSPFLGVFIYLIARGKGMTERDIADAKASQAQFDDYVKTIAGGGGGGGSTADELSKLADLKDKGIITDDEFATQKAKLLS